MRQYIQTQSTSNNPNINSYNNCYKESINYNEDSYETIVLDKNYNMNKYNCDNHDTIDILSQLHDNDHSSTYDWIIIHTYNNITILYKLQL